MQNCSLATWLVSDTHDSKIEDKEAKEELGKLIASRLEYRVSTDEPLIQIRSKLARSILFNEFRSDYGADQVEKDLALPGTTDFSPGQAKKTKPGSYEM